MKTILKTIVTLVITATVPMVLFFIMGCAVGIVLLIVSITSGTVKLDGGTFTSIFWWAFISIIISLPIAFGHLLLLGLPALLIGWYFRGIRWWSTLIVAFMIGAIRSTISVFFFQNIGWNEPAYIWQNLGVLTLVITASVATIMGFFGLSAGLVFWFLWRYWANPDSPEGRPLLVLQELEIESLGVNE